MASRDKQSNTTPRQAEMPLAVQAKILKRMESELPAFASEQDFSAAMSRKLGMDRKFVKRLWRRA